MFLYANAYNTAIFATKNDSFEPFDLLGSEVGCTDLRYFEN